MRNRTATAGVGESMSLLLLSMLLAGSAGADPNEFLYVSNCGGWSCSWLITVSQDGLVTIERPETPHANRRYRLSRSAFAKFRGAVLRERPMELSGNSLGDLAVDGPERVIRFTDGGQNASIRVHTTPPGYGQLYRDDPSGLARALRVCEATRDLGGADLRSCVD